MTQFKLYKLIFIFIFLYILIVISYAPIFAQTQTDWPMTAANPERNSHNSVEVRGNLSVDWYRVIDPFIDTKVQVIAAAGKVFVATSQGLFAFDSTTNGFSFLGNALVDIFDTNKIFSLMFN